MTRPVLRRPRWPILKGLRPKGRLGRTVADFLTQRRTLLGVILVLFVGLATWYSVTIPLGEAPDELPHFTYVRYLVQNGCLPATTEEHEAFQPPLYYALGAALTFWIDDRPDASFDVRANAYFDANDPRAPKNLLLHSADDDWPFRGWALAWHLVRLVSIALGGITVWAVYRLGCVIRSERSAIPLVMAALTAFTPQFVFLSAVANNDNAAIAFSALTLWQVGALLQEGDRSRLWKRYLRIGLLLGLGLLSKANLIALLPIAGLAIVVTAIQVPAPRAGDRIRLATLGLLLCFGLAALLAGWYFQRNWRLFGDPIGWSFLLVINARREGPLTLSLVAWLFKGLFRSFWLGWIGIALDEVLYRVIAAGCLIGLAGFLVWLVRRWSELDGGRRWALALLGLHAAVTLGALIQWTAAVQGTDQGRLIYPVLPTVMLVLVMGWAWWFGDRARPWVLGGLTVGIFTLAILTPIRYIAPVHAPAPVASQAELDAAHRLDIDWDGVRLLGYHLESAEVEPGGVLVLDLYWQAQQPVESDLMALVQLVDTRGEFLMYRDGSPTAGRDTTDRWTPGVPLAARLLLPVPDYGRTGDYHLTLSLRPFVQGKPLSESSWVLAVGPDGSVLGEQYTLPETIHVVVP
jgi:hypothetical protein